jgi:hypothetical protein
LEKKRIRKNNKFRSSKKLIDGKKGYWREKILKNNHSDILGGIEKDF